MSEMVPGERFPALGNPKLCPVQDCTGSKPTAWGCTENTRRRKYLCHLPPLSEGGWIPTWSVRMWPEWSFMGGGGCTSAWGCWGQPSHVLYEGPPHRVQRNTCAPPSPDDLGTRSWLRGGLETENVFVPCSPPAVWPAVSCWHCPSCTSPMAVQECRS